MNVDVLLKAKADIAADAANFDMYEIFHPCGTPSCIAGYIIGPVDPATFVDENGIDYLTKAKNIAGLTVDQAEALFMPKYMGDATTLDAQNAIDTLIATGMPIWNHY